MLPKLNVLVKFDVNVARDLVAYTIPCWIMCND